VITIRSHVGGRGIFLLPVSAPLVWGLADSSTSNTGHKATPPAAGRSDTAVAPRRSTIKPDIRRRATLLVTAVDELFGTHSADEYRCEMTVRFTTWNEDTGTTTAA
jgi:hypothetical protein